MRKRGEGVLGDGRVEARVGDMGEAAGVAVAGV